MSDFLDAHRWLVRDTHGIDFFLVPEFVSKVKEFFKRDYSDEELVEFFHIETDAIEEFVPRFIRQCEAKNILEYTELSSQRV